MGEVGFDPTQDADEPAPNKEEQTQEFDDGFDQPGEDQESDVPSEPEGNTPSLCVRAELNSFSQEMK